MAAEKEDEWKDMCGPGEGRMSRKRHHVRSYIKSAGFPGIGRGGRMCVEVAEALHGVVERRHSSDDLRKLKVRLLCDIVGDNGV